ncbi:MAG TPA: Xaa-Pro dipeptidase [Arsenophonus nasoniae]|uniref:Xaa-Pro dipeptidase n=1 Tax=Arsenophonus nasoniae TaxID=638 RepID=UPI003879A183
MENLASQYQEHIKILQQRTQNALKNNKLNALLIHSGEPQGVFLDDYHYPFRANPHFKAWLPITQVAHCWLLVDGVSKPKLWFYSPIDYWHSIDPLPDSFWVKEFELFHLKQANDIKQGLLQLDKKHIGYIGESIVQAKELGISAVNINHKSVLDYFHYHRAYKTNYEISCLQQAQKMAIAGHHAAREAFYQGASEFDINISYLQATGQRDIDVPYSNIIALNENCSVLHYTKLKYQPPKKMYSFLIDAGSEYHGYAADITRTYAGKNNNEFANLINDLDSKQQILIDTIKSGIRYTEYHYRMHQHIASLLLDHGIICNISEEAMIKEGLTTPFFPHGLGHLLGLQVHDVGGFMQDETGAVLAAPDCYPFLRCTRILQPGMVLTIEPGLYFIETLLAPWREGSFSKFFNWHKIASLMPNGGIRIEDNIIIYENKVENMTRNLHLK